MYRILNPLNHNVALVRNDKGEELIVIGKGIVFGKKKGDLVPKEKVEKLFRMKTEESRENFMTLLKDVPLDFITVTYEGIVNLASGRYAKQAQNRYRDIMKLYKVENQRIAKQRILRGNAEGKTCLAIWY